MLFRPEALRLRPSNKDARLTDESKYRKLSGVRRKDTLDEPRQCNAKGARVRNDHDKARKKKCTYYREDGRFTRQSTPVRRRTASPHSHPQLDTSGVLLLAQERALAL